MSNPPPLLAEDRAEYERLLTVALRDRTVLAALRAPGALATDQLRLSALREADRVNAAAGTEYERFTRLRESLHSTPPASGTEPAAPGLFTQLSSGGGLFPALTVLTPILAWAAALCLLLVGYLLRATSPDLALAGSLVTAGWVALAAGVAAMAIGIVGLLLTALRHGAATAPAGTAPELAAELTDAHRAWRTALREHGLVPYLLDALPPVPEGGRAERPDFTGPDFTRPGYASPAFTSPGPDGVTDPDGRTPHRPAFTPPDFTGPGYTPPDFTRPGYASPAFTSPGPEGRAAHPPAFTSPDFTSPGREGVTDPDGRTPRPPAFTPPDFTGPGYTPPDFTSPGPEGVTDPDGRTPRPTTFTGPGYTPPDFTGPDEVG
ncbi:hypothetical protein ACFRAR_30450 [Kitasatospora sp. NPDC056651]|uniref:hypothetical protein n=1 Tax=Kitasatospora sp. NPDC056651 TaxID=3345892 RepID=UPI00367B8C75